ncbi:MAG: RpoL/Rpb11 RNA polymerase subunit family protein [Nitrososphaerales archaeon]
MEVSIEEMKDNEAILKVTGEDISVMYILQHELLSSKKVEYAGFALKHPLTLEYEFRIVTESGSLLNALVDSAKSAQEYVEDLAERVKSKVRD